MTNPKPDPDLNRSRVMRDKALNRVTKWRQIFAGWQLGTRVKGDPEGDAVRDHREITILLRVELNAYVQLAVSKGLWTEREWNDQLAIEAALLDQGFEAKFPGARSTDDGMTLDQRFAETAKNWRF